MNPFLLMRPRPVGVCRLPVSGTGGDQAGLGATTPVLLGPQRMSPPAVPGSPLTWSGGGGVNRCVCVWGIGRSLSKNVNEHGAQESIAHGLLSLVDFTDSNILCIFILPLSDHL